MFEEVKVNTFGSNLRSIRKSLHMTLHNIARKAKISNAYLSDIELSNRQPPPKDTLCRILDALDLNEKDRHLLENKAKQERLHNLGYY